MTRLSATTALATTALALSLALPAAAFDLTAMTDAERSAFRAEVKAYLLENPELMLEVFKVLEDKQAQAEASADITLVETHKAELMQNPADWVGGNPQGDITLVEFLDYRCGYCRKAYTEVEELVKSDGNIRLIFKEYPILGEESLTSAKFAIATRMVAGDAAYKKAHDALITLRGDATPETMGALATELGLDAPAILAKMESPEVKAVIDANHALGMAMQINGTPSFVIEGAMLRGYVPLDGMREIVESERASKG